MTALLALEALEDLEPLPLDIDRGRPGDQWGELDPTVRTRPRRRSFDELLLVLAANGATHVAVGYL